WHRADRWHRHPGANTHRVDDPAESEAAEPDVRSQDRLGADRREFIHDRVDISAWYQCPHGHPRWIGERGDRGRFESGSDRGGFVEDVARAVIVQHQVLLSEHHTLHPAGQLVTGGGVFIPRVLTLD